MELKAARERAASIKAFRGGKNPPLKLAQNREDGFFSQALQVKNI